MTQERLGIRAVSRMEFSLAKTGPQEEPNTDELQTGALLRIADALESIAGNDKSLPFQLNRAKLENKRLDGTIRALEGAVVVKKRTISALKGQITRLKSKKFRE